MSYWIHKIKDERANAEGRFDAGFEILPGKAEHAYITWGEPALRLQVKFDKVCARCGLTRRQGFQLSIENNWVDCYCPRCKFTL